MITGVMVVGSVLLGGAVLAIVFAFGFFGEAVLQNHNHR